MKKKEEKNIKNSLFSGAKLFCILIMGLMITTGFSGLLGQQLTEKPRVDTPLFYDSFNDNNKNMDKWSEIYDNGTWEEVNNRCEFKVHEGHNREGIESLFFSTSFSPYKGIKFSWDVFTAISSSAYPSYSGRIYVNITDGNNSILTRYHRFRDTTTFRDSNDNHWTVLETSKDGGSWSNSITIFGDKYKVMMDGEDSEWIPDDLFSSSSELKIRIWIQNAGSSPSLTQKSAFDNIVVQGKQKVKIENLDFVFGGVKATVVSGDNAVDCSINVYGNVWFGGSVKKVVPPNVNDTLRLPFTLGFGKVTIIVSAGDIEKRYNAVLLGPFFTNVEQQ